MHVALLRAACNQPPLPLAPAVLYCKYQPSKKLRKNKSFADGVLEVAVASKKAVGATALTSWVLGRHPAVAACCRAAGSAGSLLGWHAGR